MSERPTILHILWDVLLMETSWDGNKFERRSLITGKGMRSLLIQAPIDIKLAHSIRGQTGWKENN